MDFTENEGEDDLMVTSRRKDLEELIALLNDYKVKGLQECQAQSGVTLSEEDVGLTSLVEKMVLIKRKSLLQFSPNGCSNNRLDDGDDSDTSNEEDSRESEELMSARPSTDSSEVLGNAASSLSGGVKTADLEELISLLNESLDKDDIKDETDFRRASPCSKLVRRMTAVEEILVEKRKSSQCVVPQGCGSGVTQRAYRCDTDGILRRIVKLVGAKIVHPKKKPTKWRDTANC